MRTFAVFILAASATALLGSPARAEMPVYDVERYCQGVASFGGGPSEMMLDGCHRMEQSAYDQLKPAWDQLPATLKSYCDGVARFGGGGSYEMLGGCVRMELDAAQANQSFKFKR